VDGETWVQIKSLFNQALEKSGAERTSFLNTIDDHEIRRELESLLAAHDTGSKTIENIVPKAAAGITTSEYRSLSAGQTFGQYHVERELGRGGMGEVYLVSDTRFGRQLALKVLSASFNHDPSRLRRFEHEARAVFTLNHPNIITIHETGEVDGQRFLVTEFVDGETLRDIIARGELDLSHLLKIILQVTDALVAAHGAGIVHRDIKPENIMVRRDGYIKVLDFGLAKPVEEPVAADESSARQLLASVSTAPGLVLGTVNYMSPEQARGYSVDARSDIFSLGVVLYEAVTGQCPFSGKTRNDVLIAIAGQEPEPLAEYNPEAPAELQQIVDRALRKKREERYQTVVEMRQDLEALRDALIIRARGQSRTTSDSASQRTSSAEFILDEIKRNKLKVAATAFLVLSLIAAASIGLYTLFKPVALKPALLSSNLSFNKVTTTGKASGSTISPDGKYIVYGDYNEDLFIKQLETGSSARLFAHTDNFAVYGCTFTQDSNYVYCWIQEITNPRNSFIERLPVLPGQSQKITDHVNSVPTFSPDGKHMAFLRFDEAANKNRIMIADSDGSAERPLPVTGNDIPLLKYLVWSPDGKIIAANGIIQDDNKQLYSLFGFRPDDGTAIPLTSERWRLIRSVQWLPGNAGLIMTAIDRIGGNERIWLVSYPQGTAEALTNEITSFEGVGISADGRRILTTQSDRPAAIWNVPAGDASKAKKITSLNGAYGEVIWSPDGKPIYVLANDIWMMDADGRNPHQLTFGQGINRQPEVTTDGHYMVFASTRAGDYNIWRFDLRSGEMKQLTSGGRQVTPVCTSDAKWIIYQSQVKDSSTIWKMPIEGGGASQIGETDYDGSYLSISPDDKLIAYQYRDQNTQRIFTAVRPLDGGPVQGSWPDLGLYNIQWSPDSKALLYADDKNIWSQPIDGSAAKRLTNFQDQRAIYFALSNDGRNLLVTRGDWISDVVMITVK